MYPYNTPKGERDELPESGYSKKGPEPIVVQRRPGGPGGTGPKPPSGGGPKPPGGGPGPKPPGGGPGPKPPGGGPGPRPPGGGPGPKPPGGGPDPKPPGGGPGPKPPGGGPGPKPPGRPRPPVTGGRPPGPIIVPGPGPRPRPPVLNPVPPINIWPRPIVITVPIHDSVTNMIYDAISDEAGDEEYFSYLMEIAPTETEKNILNEIRMDEQKHYYLLQEIYYSITGRRANVSPNRRTAGYDLRREYENAVFEELKDVEFYRKIMFSTENREIRDILYEIITDEQTHTVKLNYLISLYK